MLFEHRRPKKASISTTIFATRMFTWHIKRNEDPASPSYRSNAARRRDHLYCREDAPLTSRQRRCLASYLSRRCLWNEHRSGKLLILCIREVRGGDGGSACASCAAGTTAAASASGVAASCVTCAYQATSHVAQATSRAPSRPRRSRRRRLAARATSRACTGRSAMRRPAVSAPRAFTHRGPSRRMAQQFGVHLQCASSPLSAPQHGQ